MSSELRRRLLTTLESGTAKELAFLLALIHRLSHHPKTHEAGPDFPDQTGSASKHANKKSLA
jgi:hypothetical protein